MSYYKKSSMLLAAAALLLRLSLVQPVSAQQGAPGYYDPEKNTPGGFLTNATALRESAQSDPRLTGPVSAPAVDLNTLNAREDFRLGIQAFNRYAYNEAILSFERALSYQPGEPLILDWLGRSYYHSGFEDTALRQWQSALGAYAYGSAPNLLLANRIETVRNRRSLLPVPNDIVRYVESGSLPGSTGSTVFYKQPISILPHEDGSIWIVAYGTNELLRIDVNGMIRQRVRGPLNGFDRPYDLVQREDGMLYVSEYRGGRVSLLDQDGRWQSYISTKGTEAGKFIGPQHLALDEDAYLYVVDYGKNLISKFDPQGAYILSFGTKSPGFAGFLSPTGIAARDGRIYVADSKEKQIYIFDRNGTYQGTLIRSGLQGPESLRFLSDGHLLVADGNRVLLVDINSSIIRELGVRGNSRVRIVGADVDKNGNVVAVDFDGNEVSIFTRIDDVATGLYIEIERVSTDNFPEVSGTKTTVGSGKQNTEAISTYLNNRGEYGYAAQYCVLLEYSGYDDWFLPSKEELNFMYMNLKQKGLGGFRGDWYWSSSQDFNLPWVQTFSYQEGKQWNSGYYYANDIWVRAVRQF